MYDVAGILNVEYRRQFHPFASFQCQDRVPLGHRCFGLPVFVVQRQHQIHKFRIGFAALF